MLTTELIYIYHFPKGGGDMSFTEIFSGLEHYSLRDSDKQAYEDDGYFIARNLVPLELRELLAARLDSAARGELDQQIYRQIEPVVKRSGRDTGDPIDYVRKVQKLAEHDRFFAEFVTNSRLLSMIHGLYGENIRYFGDEAQLKPALVGSAHPWHQDAPYFHKDPMDVVTVWIAVDDATRENGCIEVIPGAHKRGILPRPDPNKPWFETGELDVSEAVHAEISAGDALVFDVLLPHGSGPNVSKHRRRSMICRYVNLDTVRPDQWDVVTKHGVLSNDPAAHSIFAPVRR